MVSILKSSILENKLSNKKIKDNIFYFYLIVLYVNGIESFT